MPARKPGNLPHDTVSATTRWSTATDALELHVDAIAPGARVLVHDDLLATGGTARALCQLVEQLGGEVVGCAFLIELAFLGGRESARRRTTCTRSSATTRSSAVAGAAVMNLKYLLALAGVAVLLVAGCGSDDDTTGSATAAAGNPIDRAFIADMIPHHESAVQMAAIAQRRGSSAFVKQLAEDIVRTQTAEIATMRARDQALAAAGVTRGSLGMSAQMMGMDHDASSLNSAKPFDAAFLRMMIPHHQGAVVMANAEIERGKDVKLKALARDIISAQQREIRAMRERLADGGAGGMHEGDEGHGAGMTG